MRYKPEHKEQTRRKIVETASQEFRAHGFEGIGIAKLMNVLELTHGGFYAHFADKEELVAEASVAALDQSLTTMLEAVTSGGVPALLDYYLSEGHRDHPEIGCPLPALSAEVARRTASSREAFTGKLSVVFQAIASRMPGATDEGRRGNASVMLASMTGAMSLARAVSDPVLSKSILESMREHLLQFARRED